MSKGQLSPFGMAFAGAIGGVISGSVVYVIPLPLHLKHSPADLTGYNSHLSLGNVFSPFSYPLDT